MKRTLSFDEIEAQSALELPDREMMQLITIIITNLLNNNTVTVNVTNNKVALQVCAVVTAVASLVNTPLSCTVAQ